jgi:glycosyltransferase involved in cell wall biosynthesis
VASLPTAQSHLPAATIDVEPLLRRPLHPARDVLAYRRIHRWLGAVGPELAVTHQSKAGVLGRWAASRLGVPVVQSLSMASFGPGYQWPVSVCFRGVERFMAPRTHAYAVVGHDLAAAYQGLGVPADRLHVIRSAARLPEPAADRAAALGHLGALTGLDPSRPVLAYVGSLDPRKNVLTLLDVLEAVTARHPHPRPALVVAGDGPLRDRLAEHAQARGLAGDVVLLGHVADPAPVFRAAAVFVLLSRTEGLPQVLVQAAAAATPFVAFEVSGAHELVGAGAVGTVVEWGAVDELARAVVAHLRAPRLTTRTVSFAEWAPEVSHARYRELFDSLRAVRPVGEASVAR